MAAPPHRVLGGGFDVLKVLLYPLAQHVALYLAQVDRVVEQRDLVRRVLEVAVEHVAPELPGGTKGPRGWLREPPRLSQATAADGGGPGFSHDDHVLTKQDMGGGAGPSQYGAERHQLSPLVAL